MNLLYAYPIIIPMSSGGGSADIPTEVVWAILIVANVIGLISLLITWIINAYDNKKYGERSFVDTISDYLLLFVGVGLPVLVDIIAAFVGLILWVSTLL